MTISEWPQYLYGESDGFAARFDPDEVQPSVGDDFEWASKIWTVEAFFSPDCCPDLNVALVKRKGSNLQIWSGIPCECGHTWSFDTLPR